MKDKGPNGGRSSPSVNGKGFKWKSSSTKNNKPCDGYIIYYLNPSALAYL